MKIIDLLNKIANGEEVPDKIKWNNLIWYFNEKDYIAKDEHERFHLLFDDYLHGAIISSLNEEIKIIHNQKIERPLCCHIQRGIKLNKEDLSRIAIQNKENIKNIYDKLVEIIEVLNDKD